MILINSYDSAVEIDFCINFSDQFICSENFFHFIYFIYGSAVEINLLVMKIYFILNIIEISI